MNELTSSHGSLEAASLPASLHCLGTALLSLGPLTLGAPQIGVTLSGAV